MAPRRERVGGPAVPDRQLAGVALAVAVGVAGLSLALPGAAWAGDGSFRRAPTPAPSSGSVKYYVVGAPVHGQREYLYQIAVGTLGNGNRYLEVFALNRNRPQPDGGRLTDPMVLEPGWILLLPPDASGSGVHTGPLPVVSAAPTASAVPAPAVIAPAKRAGPTGADPLQIGAIGVAVSAAVGWVVLIAGRRRRVTEVQPVTAQPADGRAQTLPAGRSVATAFGGAPPVHGPLPPIHRASPPVGSTPPAVNGAPPPVGSTPPAVNGPPPAVDGPPADGRLAAGTPAAVPAGAAEVADTELDTRLDGHGPAVTVSLLGCRGHGHAYTWRDRGAAPPIGTMAVPLGERDGRTLWVDLALAPDVVTVLGRLADSQRFGRELAERLVAAGVEVAVLGDALGPGTPVGCRRIDALPEPGVPGDGVLFCAEPPAPVRRAAARLRTAGTGQPVPVLLGGVPRARWSIQVGEPVAGPADRDQPAVVPARLREGSWRRKEVVFLRS